MSKDKYSHLKKKQKEKIAQWMVQETKDYYMKNYAFPDDSHIEEIADRVYERIAAADIRISYGKVLKHYKKKRSDINKRVRHALPKDPDTRTEKVCFMNMCMIGDEKGNVLALDKVNDSYTGTAFPGGHVEKDEVFNDSVIREVKEETGLEIRHPKLCGVYHWTKKGIHNILFLYRASEFSGTLRSSEEGEVYWIPLEEFEKKELAAGMEHVLKIIKSDAVNECVMRPVEGGYEGTVY